MIVSGWIVSGLLFRLGRLGWSLAGTAVGLALLLPAYAIGGMGAGDVKLLAGVGGLGRRDRSRCMRSAFRPSSAE